MKMAQVPMGQSELSQDHSCFCGSAPICSAQQLNPGVYDGFEPTALRCLASQPLHLLPGLRRSFKLFSESPLALTRQETACLDRLCLAHGSVFSTLRTDRDLNYCCFFLDVLLVCHKLLLKARWVSQSVLPPVHANICISAAVSSLPWW